MNQIHSSESGVTSVWVQCERVCNLDYCPLTDYCEDSPSTGWTRWWSAADTRTQRSYRPPAERSPGCTLKNRKTQTQTHTASEPNKKWTKMNCFSAAAFTLDQNQELNHFYSLSEVQWTRSFISDDFWLWFTSVPHQFQVLLLSLVSKCLRNLGPVWRHLLKVEEKWSHQLLHVVLEQSNTLD